MNVLNYWFRQWTNPRRAPLRRSRDVSHWMKFAWAAECLEARTLLSNVAVVVANGEVDLNGDSGDHTFAASVVGSNLELAGSSGTTLTFNGTTSATVDIPLSQITPLKGLHFNMQGGNDTITFDGTGLGTIAGNVVAFLGGGTNSFQLKNATVAGDVDVFGGNNGNTVTLSSDTIQDATILTGGGSDSLALSSVTFQAAPLFPNISALSGLTVGGSLFVNAGGGDDTVALDSVTGATSLLGSWWNISGGLLGNDTTTLDSVTTHGPTFVTGGLGNETVSATGSTFNGPTLVASIAGQNQINVKTSTFAGPALLSTGIGDSPTISVEDSTFQSSASFVEVGKNSQLDLESSGTSGAGSTFQGPVVAALPGPSATVNIGSSSSSDKVAFNDFVIIVGGVPQATVNIVTAATTIDNDKLFLLLAQRNNV
ncbi:MAG TPA: hypothetical protein VKU82_04170 [Planctomycetaceae bacterium]|nr:hypothetical protein [Planctomycetaceae bacterium]